MIFYRGSAFMLTLYFTFLYKKAISPKQNTLYKYKVR